MRDSAIVMLASALLIAPFIQAAAQVPETRGPRPEVVYGEESHYVTLTFYIGQNDAARLQEILDVLQAGNVSKAVFFMQPDFAASNPLANATQQMGYIVLPWQDPSQYDPSYSPTEFAGVLLSDMDVLGRTSKMADVMAFYNHALHRNNASIVAFTPDPLPGSNLSSTVILEGLLKDGGRTLVFTDAAGPASQPAAMVAGRADNVTATSIGANTTDSVAVSSGDWTMQELMESYPLDIRMIQTDFGPSYLVDTTVIVGEDARLDISGENVLIASPTQDRDRRIEIAGMASITDSFVSSWDPAANAHDVNPYHPRPFILVEGGQIEIRNSTMSHMGFPLAGLSADRSARAAMMFLESSNFTITDSVIAFNFDGIYARNSSNFRIADNEIYGNIRSGIDIRSGSNNFVISGNHVHDNGYEGVICTECTGGVHITGNTVEHSREAGIKLFTGTNSTVVDGNAVNYNENFGIYLRNNSTGNTVSNNTVTGSEEGITLTGYSNNNTIADNILMGNDVAIEIEPTSQSNVLRNNRQNATG